jgi:hypothetical protein
MKKAAEIALKYVGQQEKINNSGFKDENFEARMDKVGWQFGQAWCAFFAELVWKEAFPEKFKELDHLFNGGAVATWNNFSKNSDFVCDKVPEPGALVIWQNYKNGMPHWTGHVGIVVSVSETSIISVEGNTNSKGGREGVEVAKKIRPLNFETKQSGLVLKGFIKFKT